MICCGLFAQKSFTPLLRSDPPSLPIALGIPALSKIPVKASETSGPFQVGEISNPIHSQSRGPIDPFLFRSALSGTRNTTNAFLVPISIEQSMIATHGSLIVDT